MVDFLALSLSHGLLLLAAWQLMGRADLDQDPPPLEPEQQQAPKPAKPGLRIRA